MRIRRELVSVHRNAVILVVEDDASLREMYRDALVAEGYAVVAVDDGLNALHYLEADTPAAVVLDLELRRVRGLDVHREMRAHGRTHHVPVIVVTGAENGIDPTEVDCLLTKPIDIADLLESVRRCLEKPESPNAR